MYLPKIHEETRLDVRHALIREHPLATWVTVDDGELVVNHIPFHLEPSRGEQGTLVGHVARANPIWKTASALPHALVFRGPQAYVTPNWYPSKHEHGKAVPTWNYVIVTVHGAPRFSDDRAWLRGQLDKLTNDHEASQTSPWRIDDAPADFTEKMLAAIVGVEIPIDRIQGKWKTSQNRPDADKLGVLAGLNGKGDDEARAMAALVREHATGA